MSKQPESAATMTIPNEGIGNLGGVMSATRTSSLDQLIGDAATPLFFNLVELVAAADRQLLVTCRKKNLLLMKVLLLN